MSPQPQDHDSFCVHMFLFSHVSVFFCFYGHVFLIFTFLFSRVSVFTCFYFHVFLCSRFYFQVFLCSRFCFHVFLCSSFCFYISIFMCFYVYMFLAPETSLASVSGSFQLILKSWKHSVWTLIHGALCVAPPPYNFTRCQFSFLLVMNSVMCRSLWLICQLLLINRSVCVCLFLLKGKKQVGLTLIFSWVKVDNLTSLWLLGKKSWNIS